MSWIDVPILDLVLYFDSIIYSFTEIVWKLGSIIAVLGLIVSWFQVAWGTMDTRKVLAGMPFKWILFLLIISLYPSFTAGLNRFCTGLAFDGSSKTVTMIATELSNLMKNLEEQIDVRDEDIDLQIEKIEKNIDQLTGLRNNLYGSMDSGGIDIYSGEIEANEARLAKLEKRKESMRESSLAYKNVNAIKSVLVEVDENGNEKSGTGKYTLTLDYTYLDSSNNKRHMLSPASILKLNLITAQIMWEKEWASVEEEWSAKEKNTWTKNNVVHFPLRRIFDIVLTLICTIAIIVCCCCSVIQYAMALIEYSISTSISIVLVPCILFDGLKDMAHKILPMLFAQGLKITMIILTMLMSVYVYMIMVSECITNTSSFGLVQFGQTILLILLTLALTSNAPKLAVTILTGQPQMSMGEFMAAAATVAGGVALGAKAVEAGRTSFGSAARFGANRMGDIAGMAGAAEGAWNSSSGGISGGLSSAWAATGEGFSRAGKRAMSAAGSAVRYTGRNGGNSGSGSMKSGVMDNFSLAKKGNKDTDMSFANSISDSNTDNPHRSNFGEYLKSQYNAGKDNWTSSKGSSEDLGKDETSSGEGIPAIWHSNLMTAQEIKDLGSMGPNHTGYAPGFNGSSVSFEPQRLTDTGAVRRKWNTDGAIDADFSVGD